MVANWIASLWRCIIVCFVLQAPIALAGEQAQTSRGCSNKFSRDEVRRVDADFPVFDGLVHATTGKAPYGYLDIPQNPAPGLRKIWQLGQTTGGALVTEDRARAMAAAASLDQESPYIVLDIEDSRFPFDIRRAPKSEVDAAIEFVTRISQWMHAVNPKVKVGLYGPPIDGARYISWEYLIPLKRWDPKWRRAQPELEESNRAYVEALDYVMRRLVGELDFVSPAMYTFLEAIESDSEKVSDPQSWHKGFGWRDLTAGALDLLVSYCKPVIPFIWAQYHDGVGPIHLRGKYLPLALWAEELAVVRYNADGAILFGVGTNSGSDDGLDTWADFQPWYELVDKHMLSVREDLKPPLAPTELVARSVLPSKNDLTRVVISWQHSLTARTTGGVEYEVFRDHELIGRLSGNQLRDGDAPKGVREYEVVARDLQGHRSEPARTVIENPQ